MNAFFYHKSTIFIMYTDDGMIINPSKKNIATQMKDLTTIFDIEVQCNLQVYLGIRVTREPNGSIQTTQPHLITSILEDLQLLGQLPSIPSHRIRANPARPPFSYPWHYFFVIVTLKATHLHCSGTPSEWNPKQNLSCYQHFRS
jgi:hypothetical protein